MTFILLNGNEITYRNNNPQQINKNINKAQEHKNNVETSLISVDSQFTYDSIIYALKNNNYINKISGQAKNDKKTNTSIDYSEKDKISKLTKLLYDICFNPKKEHIKFRIIGSILPNTGYYETVKDTLLFLFNCQKAITSRAKDQEKKQLKEFLLESPNTRDKRKRKDTIFDLENKIKFQTSTIADLNRNIEKKQIKLFDLEKYYKKQVEVLKNYFGYKGSVEILLSGDENTIEYREAQKIREAKDEIIYYKNNINELEKKLKNKDKEIEKLKLEDAIKSSDRTMVKYYMGVNEIKKKKENDNKNRNEIYNKVKVYEKELENKEKTISILKKELEEKSKIIMSIPKTIKAHMDKKNDEESSISSGEVIQIKHKKKDVDKTDLIQLARYNNEEIKTLKMKYENLINQKNKQILENNYQMIKIQNDHKSTIILYENELIKFYELFMSLFNYCNNDIFPFFNNKSSLVSLLKKEEELEEFLKISKKEITSYNYPFFFKAINERKIYSKNSPKNIVNEKISIEAKKHLIEKNRIITKEEEAKDIVLNFVDIPSPTMEQIKNFINSSNTNNKYFQYTSKELEKMSKKDIIKIHNEIIKYIQELENYIKKYNEYHKKDCFNENNEYKKKMEKYEEDIKKLNILLDKEVQKNHKNMIVISSQDKKLRNY